MRKWVILLAITLSSCGSLEPVRLPLPPPLVTPTVTRDEVKCLSDDAYERLVIRDRLKDARIKTLTDVIKSTH